ncbi:uncharacterized protein [Sinocyclocheilus grahami]|uniref:uncharacterized protein n=1 Tax=Sinocyclocheilus grahami TaxID=75366 RepID=UPI0007ACAF4D|nr:PREDICTED: uncharacterized protein LOC107566419 [Sinocyclocheilus grahami]
MGETAGANKGSRSRHFSSHCEDQPSAYNLTLLDYHSPWIVYTGGHFSHSHWDLQHAGFLKDCFNGPNVTVETGALSGLDVKTGVTKGFEEGGRRGGKSTSSSVSQSIRSPSKSSSQRYIISSPSATVHWAELHSALSLSTACSLAGGTVAGSRTQSDGLGSAPPLSCSALRWLVDRGGNGLSVIGGLGLMHRTSGRWWAGLCVRSGSGEIIHGADGEWQSVSLQSPLHESGKILSRTIFGRRRSAHGVQA